MKKKVFVTGASGMVGSALVNHLKKLNYSVVSFDSSSGSDILNFDSIYSAMSGCDYVIHLAALMDSSDPNLWKVNVEGTRNVVTASIKQNIKKFVFVSSTSVYGDNYSVVSESSPVNPVSLYSKSKLAGEEVVLSSPLNSCIIRSALVFGPNSFWNGLFKMVKKNFPIPGSGKNSFQVAFYLDLVSAIELVLRKGVSHNIYLFASSFRGNLNVFYSLVRSHFSLPVKTKHVPVFLVLFFNLFLRNSLLSRENISHITKNRAYNTSKIISLGFSSEFSLEFGISHVANYLKL